MRLGKLPDQVIRLGVLGLVAIAVMLYARHRFVPKTFGETGHYRGAHAAAAGRSGFTRYRAGGGLAGGRGGGGRGGSALPRLAEELL